MLHELVCHNSLTMLDSENIYKDFDDIEEQVKNCPKDTFIEKLIEIVNENVDALASLRSSLHQKAIDKGLPTDRPLIKRQRSNPNSACRKYASDCYLLYSFINGSLVVTEIKEVFGRSLPSTSRLDEGIPSSQRTPPGTPSRSRRCLLSSPLHAQSPLSQVTSHSPHPSPAPSVPVILYDTLAEMKTDIISFKEDLKADYEAMQWQVDSLSNELNEYRNKSVQLEAQLERKMKRITDMNSDLLILKNDNNRLEKTVKSLCSALGDMKQSVSKCKSDSEESFDSLKKQASAIAAKQSSDFQRCKDMHRKTSEYDSTLKDLNCRINKVTEPHSDGMNAIRNDVKRMSQNIKTCDDELNAHASKINKLGDFTIELEKKVSSVMKNTSKLTQSIAICSKPHRRLSTTPPRGKRTEQVDKNKDNISSNLQYKNEEQNSNGTQDSSTQTMNISNIPVQVTGRAQPTSVPSTTTKAPQSKQPEYESFFIGNVDKHVSANKVAGYLAAKFISVTKINLYPSTRDDTQIGKITVEQGFRHRILDKHFFPGDVYCRPWYPKKSNLH